MMIINEEWKFIYSSQIKSRCICVEEQENKSAEKICVILFDTLTGIVNGITD